jgi:peptide-methionine (R)-S-oxide reductase
VVDWARERSTAHDEERRMTPRTEKSEQEWRSELTPAQYDVLRRKGTEPPFSGRYVHTKDDGVYRCAGCGTDLFSSDTKFDSGTGWPSFTDPAASANIELHEDRSLFMRRTEVTCATCGGHLGHVFDDGPGSSGQRYCINSASLDLDRGGKA